MHDLAHPRRRTPRPRVPAVAALAVLFGCAEMVTQIDADDIVEMLVSVDSAQLMIGRTLQLGASPLDQTGALLVGQEAAWLSRDPLVASVDETGLVTGVSSGTAYIVASLAAFADSAFVTVSSPPALVLSEDSLVIDAAAGGANPAPDSVVVTNGGVFPLAGLSVDSIAYGAGADGWLVAQLDGSTAPATLAIQAVTGGVTTAGTYRALVWVSGVDADDSPASIAVTLRVSAGPAAAVASTGGNGQTGAVGSPVATAPSVRVADAFGNSAAGIQVTFTVTAGGGSLTGAIATSDTAGIARVGSWTLGTAVGANNNTLSATAAGGAISGNPVSFTASAVAGSPASIAITAGNAQSDTVNTAVPIVPRVLVRDQFNNPVPNASVTFAVTGGGGTVSPTTAIQTLANGTATVTSWTLGTIAGTSNNTLSATVGGTGISGNPAIFTASAVAGPAASIALSVGNAQSDTVNTAVPIAPRVVVRDQFNNPVQNHAVTFAVTNGGGIVSPTTAIQTIGDGTATVTSWTLGTVAGASNNTLSATAAGTAISSNPVTFTASAVAGPPTSISVVQGDAQSDTVNTAVPVAPRVLVRDQFNNPVANHSVTFAVTAGGTGAVVVPTTPILTLADGTATVTSWTLGQTAGTNSNTLSATAGGGGIIANPLTFTASGLPGSATQLAVASGDNQSALAGSPVTPPSVRVQDQFGNGVPGVGVTFAVATGGGNVTGANPTTGPNGVATVGSWTLGAGAGTNTLSVTATGVAGSTTITATGISGLASALQLVAGDAQVDTVAATLPVAYAIKVVDTNGNAVAGVPIDWAVTGGGGSIASPSNTDAQGIATSVRVLGTTAGAQTATATLGGHNTITFTATANAGAPAIIAIAAGGTQSDTVNTTVAVLPKARVTDQFNNPITNHSVTFAVTAGATGALVVPTTPILTLADGTATITSWTLGQTAGTNNNTLSATAAGGGISGNPVTFTASAVAGPATSIALSAGNAQTDTVNTAVPIAPRVLVRDQFSNPVANHSVTFAVTAGGTGAVVAPTTPILTLPDGTATVTSWTLGQTAGTNNTLSATAAGGGISGNPVTFTASAVAGPATSIALSAGNAQTDTVNTAVPIAARVIVRDQFSNPVASHSVTFAVTAGGTGAVVAPTTPILTLADGTATVTSWTLGQTAGTNNNTLSATAAGGGIGGNPVTFTASAVAGPATSIALSAGNAQSDTVNTAVPIDPRVIVRDQFSNPVANHSVTFAVTAGGTGAVVSPTTPILTLADGTATVTSWTLGQTAGTSNTLSATAAGGGISGNPVTFTASAVAGPPTQFLILSGNNQTAVTGNNVATMPTVVLRDLFNNGVSGRTVNFTTSGGSVGTPSTATLGNGQASTTWAVNVSGGTMQPASGTFPDTLFAATSGFTTLQITGSARYSFPTHVNPIFYDPPAPGIGCTGCHGSSGNLYLGGTAAQNHASLVGVTSFCSGLPRVSASGGNAGASNSVMLLYITPLASPPCGFNHVELGSYPNELAIFTAWIRNGAPNN